MLKEFFTTHPVFTPEESGRFLEARGSSNRKTRQSLLSYHQNQGHIQGIRRGLYGVVPPGVRPGYQAVDPFLVAARLTDDAMLAYHTALSFFGVAHSIREEFTVLSLHPVTRSLEFRGSMYRAVRPSRALGARRLSLDVETRDRAGQDVRVTSLERTLVDVLDRPALCGGWEEAWLTLESVEFF